MQICSDKISPHHQHFSTFNHNFESVQDSAEITCAPPKIRRAFLESLQILGWSALDLVVNDLDGIGVFIGKCSLGEIASGLTKLFGTEVTEIIMNRITHRLAELEGTSAEPSCSTNQGDF